MKNLITAIFSVVIIGISTCSKKGLDNTNNEQEKEHHENFRNAADMDSSQGHMEIKANKSNSTL